MPSTKTTPRKADKLVARVLSTRTAVIVLGMHRSGTSATAGTLAHLGCDLPATEMPATKFNEKGFFESLQVYEINNDIMKSAGIDWRDWQPFSKAWLRSNRADEFLPRAVEALNEEFGGSSLFVMKDPRTCRLVPFWRRALNESGSTPVFVHVHRNPLEVAASLQKVKRVSSRVGQLIWLRYQLDAEAATRGLPRSFVSFSRFMQNWKRETEKIEADVDITLPRRSLQVTEEINAFLSKDLKHFLRDDSDVFENPNVTEWIRDCYGVFEKWAAEGEDEADFETLDAINHAFSTTAPVFGPLVSDGETDRNKPSPDTVAILHQELKAREQALKAEAEKGRAIALQLEETERQLAETRSKLTQTESALQQRQQESEDTSREAKKRDAERAEFKARVAALETELNKERKNSGLLLDQIQIRYEELSKLGRMVASLENRYAQELEEKDKVLATARDDLSKAREKIGALQKVEAAHGQLQAVHAEFQAAQADLAAELEAMRHSRSWRITAPLRRVMRLARRGQE